MLHSLVPCGNCIRWLSIIILLFSTTCRVIAAPVGGPSQSVGCWDNPKSRSYEVYFRRVRYEGPSITDSAKDHEFNEVAEIAIGTTAGILTPAYDKNMKDWFVKWEPDRTRSQAFYKLGKIWLASHTGQQLIMKVERLSHAADPTKAINEALSVLKAGQFFEDDEAGNRKYQKWYREMSELKEQAKAYWIVSKDDQRTPGPSSEQPGSVRPGPGGGPSSPGPVQGSSSSASACDSSSPGSVRGSPNPGSPFDQSSAQSSKTAESLSHSKPNVPDSNRPTYNSPFSQLEEYYDPYGYPNGLYPGN
ncbi:hypothetical protein EV360DRAFT_89943 [Lentinula raphanica]|nr:hypothetical protein EV360DRAFT_89943 [Lentinula raphanica]